MSSPRSQPTRRGRFVSRDEAPEATGAVDALVRDSAGTARRMSGADANNAILGTARMNSGPGRVVVE